MSSDHGNLSEPIFDLHDAHVKKLVCYTFFFQKLFVIEVIDSDNMVHGTNFLPITLFTFPNVVYSYSRDEI